MLQSSRFGRIQQLKNYLVSQGPDHPAVRYALRLAGLRKGWRVRFGENSIHMRRNDREIIFAKKEFVNVPLMFSHSEYYFSTMLPDRHEPHPIWDYSQPAYHSYRRSNLRFFCPAVPEEDAMEAYAFWYSPKAGDVVWDVGAHAGVTTYFLSLQVGPTGRVFACEPDEFNYQCLLRNIAEYGLKNVTPIRKALDGKSGTIQFQMDGTMGAAIQGYQFYRTQSQARSIEALSLADAVAEYGAPAYIKMDIEGAEVAVVAGGVDCLRSHRIHWAIETNHFVNGELTYREIERRFRSIGYRVHSSDQFQLWHTWAAPEAQSRTH